MTNKAANDSYAAPTDATGDINTRLHSKSGPVAVVEAVASVLRTAGMCNKIARRLNDLKHDASLDSVACRIRLVSIIIEFLRPSLRCIPSNEDKDGILKECLADIESFLVRITEGLETCTDSGSTNLVKSVLHLGQTRTARQRLRALEIELDKQQNTLSTHVSSQLPGRWDITGQAQLHFHLGRGSLLSHLPLQEANIRVGLRVNRDFARASVIYLCVDPGASLSRHLRIHYIAVAVTRGRFGSASPWY